MASWALIKAAYLHTLDNGDLAPVGLPPDEERALEQISDLLDLIALDDAPDVDLSEWWSNNEPPPSDLSTLPLVERCNP